MPVKAGKPLLLTVGWGGDDMCPCVLHIFTIARFFGEADLHQKEKLENQFKEARKALAAIEAQIAALGNEEAAIRKQQAELQQEREKFNRAKQK